MQIPKDQILIGISSHRDYYRITLPKLVPQLLASGVKTDQLYVALSGYDAKRESSFLDIPVHEVDHNSFEFTALIEMLGKSKPPYVFLLHDTCEVGNDFLTSISHADTKQTEFMSVDPVGYSNMGLFQSDFIDSIHVYLESLRNTTKIRAMMAEKMFARLARVGYYESGVLPARTKATYVYGGLDHVERVSQYYPASKITKHIANYDCRAGSIFRP